MLLTVPAGALTGCVVAMFSVLVAELSDELGLNGLLVLLVSGPFLVCSACIVQARLIVKWLLT